MTNKAFRILAAAALSALLALPAGAAVGIASQFIDVEISGLKPGKSYNIRELEGVPYSVVNKGDAPADIAVDAQIPHKSDVQAPYEAIPDPSWVEMIPSRLRVDPNGVGFADVVIHVPDDPKLKGRHFQVTLWSHTLGTGLISAGVQSRVRFSIGPSPETQAERALAAAVVTLNYDLWPNAIYASDAATGARYDVQAREGRQWMLTNRADKPLTLVPEAAPWPVNSLALPAGGWEAVKDLGWVKFDPPVVTVDPFSVKPIKLVVDHAPAALAGKRAAFLVQLKLTNGMVVSANHQVFVTFAAPQAPEKK
ncbi:MAG: hypothetical protein KGL53_13135 [Elusimicrobia bacterium]|nr:hypothetical protein [Elusimicrobiota bacterium]